MTERPDYIQTPEQRTAAPSGAQPSMLPGFGQCTVSVLPSAVSTSAKKR